MQDNKAATKRRIAALKADGTKAERAASPLKGGRSLAAAGGETKQTKRLSQVKSAITDGKHLIEETASLYSRPKPHMYNSSTCKLTAAGISCVVHKSSFQFSFEK